MKKRVLEFVECLEVCGVGRVVELFQLKYLVALSKLGELSEGDTNLIAFMIFVKVLYPQSEILHFKLWGWDELLPFIEMTERSRIKI